MNYVQNLPVEADVLVIAGDFASSDLLKNRLTTLCERFPKVLFVTGNHEYYETSRTNIHQKLKAIENRFPNFKHLNNEVIVMTELDL